MKLGRCLARAVRVASSMQLKRGGGGRDQNEGRGRKEGKEGLRKKKIYSKKKRGARGGGFQKRKEMHICNLNPAYFNSKIESVMPHTLLCGWLFCPLVWRMNVLTIQVDIF